MKTLLILDIFVFTLFIINVKGQNNPCPNVFEYQRDGNRKYGIITIPGPGEGKTVVIAEIAIYGEIYNSNSGGLSLRKSLDNTVADAKRGLNVQYTFNFPQSEQWPIVTKISLNYQTICSGQEISNVATWKYEHSFTYPAGRTQLSTVNRQSPVQMPGLFLCIPNCNSAPTYPIYPETSQREPVQTQPPPTPAPPRTPAPTQPTPSPPRPVSSSGPAKPDDPAWLKTFRFVSTCGKRENFTPADLKPTELILGGVPVEVKEYPWMVAMYLFERGRVKYACGATLVTDRHVITAAHCTKNQNVVRLVFGKHDLSKNEPSIDRTTNDISEHPEYVVNQAHADIAIVAFDPIEFSDTIKPICIWALGAVFDTIIRQGTITGWGQADRESDFSELPMQLNISRTDMQTCRNSHPLLRTLASDKTFCAGGESKGPCRGDSGSGFYIQHKQTFYLRGIISHSLSATQGGPCLLDNYAVYTDLIYFLDWIKKKIE